jgi:hypothetical protein
MFVKKNPFQIFYQSLKNSLRKYNFKILFFAFNQTYASFFSKGKYLQNVL